MVADSAEPPVLDSLRRAVAAAPADARLRLLLVELLLEHHRVDEAIANTAKVLADNPPRRRVGS
jgi:predicted Zn-dependent protease